MPRRGMTVILMELIHILTSTWLSESNIKYGLLLQKQTSEGKVSLQSRPAMLWHVLVFGGHIDLQE